MAARTSEESVRSFGEASCSVKAMCVSRLRKERRFAKPGSVLSSTRRHLTTSSTTVSSVSVSFLLRKPSAIYPQFNGHTDLLPPFPTTPANNAPSASMPFSTSKNSTIHASFAVLRCTLNEMRCFTSLESVGFPFLIPSTYHAAVFGVAASLDLSISFGVDDHQLPQRLPVICGTIGSASGTAGADEEEGGSGGRGGASGDGCGAGTLLGGAAAPPQVHAMGNRFIR